MKKNLSLIQMLVLNAYWVGLSFMWNALHPIILPASPAQLRAGRPKKYLPRLVDLCRTGDRHVHSAALRRNLRWLGFPLWAPPSINGMGTLFDLVFLSILAWGGGFAWLIVGYIGLQFSSNIAHGPLQGLLPDRVPENQLGVASSLKTFMDMFSLIIASLLAGRLLDPQTRNPTTIMLVVIGLLVISASITIFFTPEEPTHDRPRMNWGSLRAQFKIDFRQNMGYWWLIAERALFLLGIYGVQAFAQYYLQDVLRVPDPPKQTGDLLASITLGLVVLVLIGGWLTDKFGAKDNPLCAPVSSRRSE